MTVKKKKSAKTKVVIDQCILINNVIKYNPKCLACELCCQWISRTIEPENENEFPIWLNRRGPIVDV